MQAQARAGIDLYQNVLRYAEVEQYGNRYRLLRLGSCDFDFDLTQELLSHTSSGNLETVAEALKDVFAGSVSEQISVAIHPPGGYSFFTPLANSLTSVQREARIAEEVKLLTYPAVESTSLHVTADPVYEETMEDGRGVSWFHVWAMHDFVHERFQQIFGALPYRTHQLKLSMQAAAAVVTGLEERGKNRAARTGEVAYTLALGWYGSHVEYTLCRNGRWYFSHYATVQSLADSAYFAVTLLRRLGLRPSDIVQVYVYGRGIEENDFAIFAAIFDTQPERLNPIPVVDLDPGSLSTDFDAEAYVPCIGVAL